MVTPETKRPRGPWQELSEVVQHVPYGTSNAPGDSIVKFSLIQAGVNNAPPPYNPSAYKKQVLVEVLYDNNKLTNTFLALRPGPAPQFKVDHLERELYNACYGKLRAKVYDGSIHTLVDVGEWWQTRSMLLRRSATLAKAAEALTGRVLRTKPTPRIKRTLVHARARYNRRTRRPKLKVEKWMDQTASAWLETIFGWVPLAYDLYGAAFTVCQNGVPPVEVRARHEILSSRVLNAYNGPQRSYGWEFKQLDAYNGALGAKLESWHNPNLWLTERLGALNLATAAWDLIPWSFAIDWVVNVSQCCQSITDFVGLKVSDIYWSKKHHLTRHQHVWDGDAWRTRGDRWFEFERTIPTDFPRPTLQFRALPEGEWRRTLTGVSLVVQQMLRLRRAIYNRHMS